MKPLKAFFVLTVIFFSFVIGGSTLAAGPIDSNANQFFKIYPKGPISVSAGDYLRLGLNIENEDPAPRVLKRLTIVVIEPFNGTRLFGPVDFWVGQAIGTTFFKRVKLGPFEDPDQDLTAAAIIFAVGENDEVNGYSGWGFVIE